MKWIALLLFCLPLLADNTVQALGYKWTVPIEADWKVENGELKLLVARMPTTTPRRPKQFAIAETPDFTQFTLECDVRRTNGGSSLIIVYAYKDESHFNYIHLSEDTAVKQAVHNGIFHVFGGERVRISSLKGPSSLPTADWHHVKVDYDGTTGAVTVLVDNQPNISLKAVEMSLSAGRIGLGSFGETADFRNLKISGK
jgi:hypothetical protein